MQTKNKWIWILALTSLFGCGGRAESEATRHVVVMEHTFIDKPDSSESTDQKVDEYDEPATDAGDRAVPGGFSNDFTGDGEVASDGDFGQTAQAVQRNSLYGAMPRVNNPCTFPNTNTNPCIVPPDRTVQYGWLTGFPTTHSTMPGIDFDERLHAAIDEIKTLPFLTGWNINYVAGKGETVQLSSNTNGGLGTTAYDHALTADTHNAANTEFYVHSTNACLTRLNPTVMHTAWSTLTFVQQQAKVKRLIEHEIGHCLGFSDFDFSGSSQFLMYAFDNSVFTYTPAEQNSLSFFRP